MSKRFLFIFAAVFLLSCASTADDTPGTEAYYIPPAPATAEKGGYDAEKGEGRFTNISIGLKLNRAKAAAGEKVYQAKCISCHKLSFEKLVGPGLKEVTKKRHPAWVLNFISNTDAMLNKDPLAQRQLEICMVRMPNLNLNDAELLNVYEYMRFNDSVK